jgi:hypothetical protein
VPIVIVVPPAGRRTVIRAARPARRRASTKIPVILVIVPPPRPTVRILVATPTTTLLVVVRPATGVILVRPFAGFVVLVSVPLGTLETVVHLSACGVIGMRGRVAPRVLDRTTGLTAHARAFAMLRGLQRTTSARRNGGEKSRSSREHQLTRKCPSHAAGWIGPRSAQLQP